MPSSPDVIIIGAGVIGCATARELARRGVSVRVFDARSIGAGATQASAGVLAPYIEADEGSPLFEMAVRSLGMYDLFAGEVSADSGIAIEYRRCGSLEVAIDDESAERLRQRVLASSSGLLRWVDAESVRAEGPALAAVRGGIFVPTHGYVDASVLTEALAWAAMRDNAEIETGRRVAHVAAGDRHVTVRTADGASWTAGTLVVAAGSWSSDHAFAAISAPESIYPIRGQLVRLALPGLPLSRIIWGPDCYIVPRAKGLVLVGATVEDVGFDERTTVAGVRDLLGAACELVPGLWRASFVEARAGLRPATASGLPIIERSPDNPKVVYATGHFRNGVLLAPLAAQRVADLVMEQ
jgi:glycine oxidase